MQRLRPGDVLEQLHPLVVLDALGLHRARPRRGPCDCCAAEHRPRVLERRLDDGHHVQRVRRATPRSSRSSAASAKVDSGWLREKSFCRSTVSRSVRPVSSGVVQPLDHAGGEQRAVDLDRPADQPDLACAVLVVVAQQVPHALERVAVAGDHVEQHRVADPHPRTQRLGLGRDQPVEGVLAPGDEPLRRLLALDLALLLRVVTRLRQRPWRSRPRGPAPGRRPCRRCRSRPGPRDPRSGGTPAP